MKWLKENLDGIKILSVFTIIFILIFTGIIDWIFNYIINPIFSGFFSNSNPDYIPGENFPWQ